MNTTSRKILTAVFLIAAAAVVAAVPVKLYFVEAIVGIVGILYAVAMWSIYRTSFRTPQTLALAIAAVIVGASGIMLLLNRLFGFADVRYTLAAESVALGIITIALGLQLKEKSIFFWLYVVIAGVGAIASGLISLIRARLFISGAFVTAAVILLYPVIYNAITNRNKKDKNIVTVREKDIEIIPPDDENGETENKR